MKRFISIVVVGFLTAVPVHAQEADEDIRDGLNLLEQGTRLILRELLQEIGPALSDLEGKIIDLNAFHLPEVLPNGDIIIRRKTPLPETPSEGEIDL